MIAAAGMIVQELTTGEKLAAFALMGKGASKNAAPKFDGVAYAKSLPGVTEPLGFWDPLGFCSDEKLTEGKLKFYREVELKHGRVGMLAALGFVVGENFHPLFGGPLGKKGGMPWEIRADFESGDLGFDPLGLKPTDPAELKEMQTKELEQRALGDDRGRRDDR